MTTHSVFFCILCSQENKMKEGMWNNILSDVFRFELPSNSYGRFNQFVLNPTSSEQICFSILYSFRTSLENIEFVILG